MTSCLPDVKDKTGCRETVHDGIKVRSCLCNTDLCNGSGGGGVAEEVEVGEREIKVSLTCQPGCYTISFMLNQNEHEI